MSQNPLGSKTLGKQAVIWRSNKRTYLIIRFVGHSLRLLRFLFVCLAIFKIILFWWFDFILSWRKGKIEILGNVGRALPYPASAGRMIGLGLCVGPRLSASLVRSLGLVLVKPWDISIPGT